MLTLLARGAERRQVSVVTQCSNADLIASPPSTGLAQNISPQPVDSTADEVAKNAIGGDGLPPAPTALVPVDTVSMEVEGSASASAPTVPLQPPPLARTASMIGTLKGAGRRQRKPDLACTPLHQGPRRLGQLSSQKRSVATWAVGRIQLRISLALAKAQIKPLAHTHMYLLHFVFKHLCQYNALHNGTSGA